MTKVAFGGQSVGAADPAHADKAARFDAALSETQANLGASMGFKSLTGAPYQGNSCHDALLARGQTGAASVSVEVSITLTVSRQVQEMGAQAQRVSTHLGHCVALDQPRMDYAATKLQEITTYLNGVVSGLFDQIAKMLGGGTSDADLLVGQQETVSNLMKLGAGYMDLMQGAGEAGGEAPARSHPGAQGALQQLAALNQLLVSLMQLLQQLSELQGHAPDLLDMGAAAQGQMGAQLELSAPSGEAPEGAPDPVADDAAALSDSELLGRALCHAGGHEVTDGAEMASALEAGIERISVEMGLKAQGSDATGDGDLATSKDVWFGKDT